MAKLIRTADGYEAFSRYIHHRISKNKNAVICCTGQTGSGKSYSNLRMCQDMDNGFSINQVAFNPEQFMAIVNSGILKRKGAALLYDEAGVTFNSRSWYSITNKMLHYFLQTCRSQNQILFFNAPDFSFIDSGARKLFHIHMETDGIDFQNKTCALKPKVLQVNQSTGKIYKKYLRVRTHAGYGGIKPVKRIHVNLPSQEIIEQYEEKKAKFMQELNQEIYSTLINSKRKPLTELQQKWYDLFKSGFNVEQIAEREGYSLTNSYKHREAIIRKGYALD